MNMHPYDIDLLHSSCVNKQLVFLWNLALILAHSSSHNPIMPNHMSITCQSHVNHMSSSISDCFTCCSIPCMVHRLRLNGPLVLHSMTYPANLAPSLFNCSASCSNKIMAMQISWSITSVTHCMAWKLNVQVFLTSCLPIIANLLIMGNTGFRIFVQIEYRHDIALSATAEWEIPSIPTRRSYHLFIYLLPPGSLIKICY